MNRFYSHEEKAVRIRTRLSNNVDTLTELLVSGNKITIVPTRSAIKIFAGTEHRLDLDNQSSVGGVANE